MTRFSLYRTMTTTPDRVGESPGIASIRARDPTEFPARREWPSTIVERSIDAIGPDGSDRMQAGAYGEEDKPCVTGAYIWIGIGASSGRGTKATRDLQGLKFGFGMPGTASIGTAEEVSVGYIPQPAALSRRRMGLRQHHPDPDLSMADRSARSTRTGELERRIPTHDRVRPMTRVRCPGQMIGSSGPVPGTQRPSTMRVICAASHIGGLR